jgi:hypothetical protein
MAIAGLRGGSHRCDLRVLIVAVFAWGLMWQAPSSVVFPAREEKVRGPERQPNRGLDRPRLSELTINRPSTLGRLINPSSHGASSIKRAQRPTPV